MPVDIIQAVDLKYNKHLSYAQIAKVQGVTPQAIHQQIKNLLPIPEVKVYQDHKADILDHVQLKILMELDSCNIKRMMERAPGAAALWFNSAFNNARLERGQSTSNVDMHVLSAKESEIKAKLAKLQAERAKLDSNTNQDVPRDQTTIESIISFEPASGCNNAATDVDV